MVDFTKLSNEELLKVRKYFEQWNSDAMFAPLDVPIPEDEYWKNFVEKNFIVENGTIGKLCIVGTAMGAVYEMADRFEKLTTG